MPLLDEGWDLFRAPQSPPLLLYPSQGARCQLPFNIVLVLLCCCFHEQNNKEENKTSLEHTSDLALVNTIFMPFSLAL